MKVLRSVVLAAACAALPICAAAQTATTEQTKKIPPGQMKKLSHHNDAAAQLRQDMRKLWTDHVVWTRDFIIAALADQPDAQVASNRLMRNQDDIGKAVAKYYGANAGQQLTTLLKDHIAIAADLVKAAKAGDKAGQQRADQRWQDNAVQIADFLAKANPNWPRATLVDLMKMHLSTTTNEVVARLNKNWDEDVRAFDAVYDHILKMSDALADGIVKQFPDKFEAMPTATSGRR
jgi:hypothetical protein